MSLTQWIVTIIEGLAVLAVIVAVLYEPALAKWEKKQGEKMLKKFKKMKECRK